MMTSAGLDLDSLDFSKDGGLVTLVAQDAVTGSVLMVAHANREALERTLVTGEMHYTSRSRGERFGTRVQPAAIDSGWSR